jgi:monoamine oxidase
VIGAGAAGLAAAARLTEAGKSVHVVEARTRAGGRIHTIRPPEASGPVELGAEFVHGEAPRTRGLLSELGVSPTPVEGHAWQAEDGRVRLADDVWDRIERVLGGLDAGRDPDRSVAEHLRAHRIDVPADDAKMASAFVEGFHAADLERVSERALAGEDTEAASDSSRVAEGQDRVVAALMARVGRERVTLGRAVRRLSWRAGRVELETVRAEWGDEPALLTASAAIVTVPIGVLKHPEAGGSLRFDPALPEVDRVLEGLAMGSVVRLTLAFERFPWGELIPTPSEDRGPPSFLHTPAERFNAVWSTVDGGGLVSWSGGSRSRSLPGDERALRELVLAALARSTGADAAALDRAVRGCWGHDWRADPWSCGAYTYIRVGGVDAPARLGRPVAGTVFFAGEATSASLLGTVEGALASGERAADELLTRTGV